MANPPASSSRTTRYWAATRRDRDDAFDSRLGLIGPLDASGFRVERIDLPELGSDDDLVSDDARLRPGDPAELEIGDLVGGEASLVEGPETGARGRAAPGGPVARARCGSEVADGGAGRYHPMDHGAERNPGCR